MSSVQIYLLMNKRVSYFLIAFLVSSIVFNVVTCRGKAKAKNEASELRDFFNIANDSLIKTIDAQGRQIGRTQVLELENFALLKDIEYKDTVLTEMLSIIDEQKKRLKSVTAITTETSVMKTLPTIIRLRDTVIQYVAKFEDKWVKLNTVSDADSTSFDLQIQNEFYAWSKYGKRKGLFGERPLDIFVRSENPYTDIKRVEQFTIKAPTPRRIGLGLFAGYGISSNMQLRPSAGVGLFYRIK